jgi:hypothetical protein
LILKKINFDIRDQNNDTVQNIAFKIDKNNAISKMLKSAILENAIPTGALDRMQDIIEHGADVANVDKKGNNLLHRLAASAGPMNQTSLQKAVDFLPNSGSLLLQANKKGKTPIDIARTSKDAVIKHVIGSSSSGPSR